MLAGVVDGADVVGWGEGVGVGGELGVVELEELCRGVGGTGRGVG